MKYLKFYKKCMETGELPSEGLCSCLPEEAIDLIAPSGEEEDTLHTEGKPWLYWGYGKTWKTAGRTSDLVPRTFTPLRQTLVLLLAAINNEL